MIQNLSDKPWLIHVPAAAVRHEWYAFSVFVGCKAYLDDKEYFC
jgi:hypothetical protein